MTRAYIQAQPNPPLANTGTGAAGTVLGTERAAITHANRALLDTYTQTEANLADAVTKRHTAGAEHANLATLDAITAAFLTADEAKLDAIGTILEAVLGASAALATGAGGPVSYHTLTLTTGIWLVFGKAVYYANTGSSVRYVASQLRNQTDNVVLDYSAQDLIQNAVDSCQETVYYGPGLVTVPSGTKVVGLEAKAIGSSIGATVTGSATPYTWIRAVRIG